MPSTVPLGYRSRNPQAAPGEGDPFPDKPVDLYLPLALLSGGAVVHVVAAMLQSRSGAGFQAALREIGMGLVIGPAVMMVGLLIAAKFRAIDFGNFGTAAMKLAAIAIAPGAIGILIAPLGSVIPLVGGLGVFIVEFALYFALIGAMFKLDESDTWYCVCVFFVLNVAMYFAMRSLRFAQ